MGSWLTVPIPPKTGSHDPAVTNVTRTQLEIVTGAGGRVFSIFRKRVERAELLASEQRARGNGERATRTYPNLPKRRRRFPTYKAGRVMRVLWLIAVAPPGLCVRLLLPQNYRHAA